MVAVWAGRTICQHNAPSCFSIANLSSLPLYQASIGDALTVREVGRVGCGWIFDLPAAMLKTAMAGRRSFWANIVMVLCFYSNFLNVSAAQLYDLMPAESSDDRIVRLLLLWWWW